MSFYNIWTLGISLLVVAATVWAVVHAVMTRREVGTAVAWVGVIVLSPGLGALAYFLLGINRIRRRARELREDEVSYLSLLPPPAPPEAVTDALGAERAHLQPLARLVDSASGRPLLPGNRIEPLVDGAEAFPAMLAAIESAEHSITLASYIFDNDRAGKRFKEALVAAKARGVEVRVLIDAVGARYSFPPMTRALKRAGIRTARFMPAFFHWRMPYFNLRNHRKLLVVDGRIGFTGGMNIREAFWSETADDEPHGHDLHFRLEGPVVAELQEAFAQDWTFTTRERLTGERWFPRIEPVGPVLARGIADGPDVDFETLLAVLLGAASVARERIDLVTPYFIPDVRLRSALATAARRGVQVTIILPEKSNLALVDWASRAYWASLLAAGCRFVLTPAPFDHAKLAVVDDAWTLFGSANLDPRSLALNFEFNVESYDAELAARARALIDERTARGRELYLAELNRWSFATHFRNRMARLLSPYL